MNPTPRLILGVLALLLAACNDPPLTADPASPDPADPPPAVAAHPYRFDIGGRVFEPAPGVPPDFLPRVEESIAKRQEAFAGAPQAAFLLVQFHQPLDRATRKRLDNNGVTILDRITNHSWIASADLISARSLHSDPDVRWAEVYPDDVKLSADARRPEPFAWQIRPGGQAAYSVLFHRNVPVDEVEALPAAIPGLVLEAFDPQIFPELNTALVVIDPANRGALTSIHAVRWIEPDQAPTMNLNLDQAQPTSNVHVVQAAPYNLTGRGITVGIWEEDGVIDTAPLDLAARVVVEAGQTVVCGDHAVHVAGTVGASGENVPHAKGMAPQVKIASWDTLNDTGEMSQAANSPGGPGNPTPIVASNHSYGATIGWHKGGTEFNDNQGSFGQYTTWTRRFDVIVSTSDLIISIAAGNDRNDAAAQPGPDKPPADCRQGGLNVAADCISPKGSAKNVMTVGASNGADSITEFSSFGPSDDGRIKPDLMAHGANTVSLGCDCAADHNGDGLADNVCATAASLAKSGTSMATPVVTGVVALMLEQADKLGIFLTAAGMRALLIQTAKDMAGIGQSSVGPDFASGWGIVDARAAADLLRHAPGSRLLQKTLDDAGPENAWTQAFSVPEGQPELRVTLAWTDPAGNPTDAPANPELFNDLDLRLIAPDHTVFGPWTLDHTIPGAAAERNGGDDAINNVEQVSVLKPRPGTWTVQVSAKKGSLVFKAQRFALAGSVALGS